jgi:hypothetical protein
LTVPCGWTYLGFEARVNPKRLLIECTDNILPELGPEAGIVEKIGILTALAESRYGIGVDFVVYQGMNSRYAGGRTISCSLDEIRGFVRILNDRGISFALAINGGLTLPAEIEPSEEESDVLDLLHTNNGRYGVTNKVIVTHEGWLPFIRKHYSSLSVVASCIQSLNPRQAGGYGERLKEYDYVVPLNQHNTHACLGQYEAYAHKLVLLLTVKCGRPDLDQCYTHYASVELHYGEGDKRRVLGHKELPAWEPSSLPEEAFSCLLLDTFSPAASLIERSGDLSKLMQMGVNKYKIARLYAFQQVVFERLLLSAQQYL